MAYCELCKANFDENNSEEAAKHKHEQQKEAAGEDSKEQKPQ